MLQSHYVVYQMIYLSACGGGSGWDLVRGAPYIPSDDKQKWFLSTNSFYGTNEYGDVNFPEKPFSKRFDTVPFDEVDKYC